MVNYSCDICGKQFNQKGNYTKHINKINPCVIKNKVKDMLDKIVEVNLHCLSINHDNNDNNSINGKKGRRILQ